jgi:pyridoxal phosphate enzyme (YggS family)
MRDDSEVTRDELAERIEAIHERIATAARRAGRNAADVSLLAVSKERPAEMAFAAYAAGQRCFGENRVEEAGPKIAAVAELIQEWHGNTLALPPEWHMIGHLQSRKAAQVIPWAAMVHSVDSEKLARRLNTFASEAHRELPILLEVNVADEASKDGLAPEAVPALIETILTLPALRLEGLMTVAPIAADPDEVRPVFAALRELLFALARRFPQADWRHLSMGMTDDFEVAIEEGATLVRIGRAIFGERPSCKLN